MFKQISDNEKDHAADITMLLLKKDLIEVSFLG